jgi:hypothetical protein
MNARSLRKAAFAVPIQVGFSRGVEDSLLEGDRGAPVFELEGGDLVVEEGGVLDQTYHRREGVVGGGTPVEVLGAL